AGTYRWIASYSGDTNNNGFTTTCNEAGETSMVNKASPTMTTSATATDRTSGAKENTATLSGGTSPTGTISFSIYGPNDATCSGSATSAGSATVSGNGSYSSSAMTENVAGAYRWIASYSGDANNNGFTTTCNEAGETSTVNKASPSMTTSATATATAGGTIQDTATLSNGTSPTGTISFSIYGPNDATCSGTATSAGSATVSGNGSYSSSAMTENVAGAYRWMDSYSGDANHKVITYECIDVGEQRIDNKASPTMTSTATATATPDPSTLYLHDALPITSPTGTISFSIYGPNDATCSGKATSAGSATVSGNGSYSSSAVTENVAGAYRWIASYRGRESDGEGKRRGNGGGESRKGNNDSTNMTTTHTQPGQAGR